MWTVLLEVFKAGGPLLALVAIVIAALLFTIRLLWKELGKERELNTLKIQTMMDKQDDKFTNVVHQMFDVVNKNTEAHSRNTEATKELKDSMRDLRMSIASH